ncbi:MAG: hypothetical protein ACPGSI_15055 [Pikeienuella sp.]
MKLLLSTALAVLLACGPAFANCGPSLKVLGTLSGKWRETVMETRTLTQPDTGLEVQWHIWANEETGTWSLTGTHDGITCLFASGRGYAGQTIADFLTGERS